MRDLTIVYDQQCGLCSRLGGWLRAQPKWIGIHLVPSQRAAKLYPSLAASIEKEELIVVSDEGGVYLGDHAWLMCLYALKDYRHWAKRLSGPALLPLARQAFTILSANRLQISNWLRLKGDDELGVHLRSIHSARCHGTGA